jgi:hypothetical protein
MGGGELIASFLDEQAIDEFVISVAPVFIGDGIPLIARRHRHVPLDLRPAAHPASQGEDATVFVNGRRAGSVWAPPYRVEVTSLLRDGANEIRIDVYNTALNRLAEGGHLPDMKALVERYGQRTRLQDLEGLRPLPSGILSPPRLVAER